MCRHRMAVLASTLLLAVACASAATVASASDGSQVPLTLGKDGHDTVPVYVNGKGPYPFILDSGADGSAV